jgi:hypothetical protein
MSAGGGAASPAQGLRIIDHNHNQLDTVDLESDDPFSLESFGRLIETHANESKAFIIARVDTQQTGEGSFSKSFNGGTLRQPAHFYYSAHSLNKVIFRTFGPEQEYLFRLYALNPLTNTPIYGDIHYYLVVEDLDMDEEQTSTFRERLCKVSKLGQGEEDKNGPCGLVSLPCIPPQQPSGHLPFSKDITYAGESKRVFDALMAAAIGKSDQDITISQVAGKGAQEPGLVKDGKSMSGNVSTAVGKLNQRRNANHKRRQSVAYTLSFVQPEELTTNQQKGHASMPTLNVESAPLASTASLSSITKEVRVNDNNWIITLKQKSLPRIKGSLQRISPPPPCRSDEPAVPRFKAIFIGTDDDYLTKSSLRDLFKNNALSDDDYSLYTIAPEVLIREGIILDELLAFSSSLHSLNDMSQSSDASAIDQNHVNGSEPSLEDSVHPAMGFHTIHGFHDIDPEKMDSYSHNMGTRSESSFFSRRKRILMLTLLLLFYTTFILCSLLLMITMQSSWLAWALVFTPSVPIPIYLLYLQRQKDAQYLPDEKSCTPLQDMSNPSSIDSQPPLNSSRGRVSDNYINHYL